MTRIHVSPLDWERAGSPSVGARCPAVTVPNSKGVAVPAAQGQGAGLPEGLGRSKTANRHPPQCGARVLPRLASAMAVPDRGRVARRGQGGMRRLRAGDTGACQGGLCGRGGPHQAG